MPGGRRAVEVLVALTAAPSESPCLFDGLQVALRADSPGAPSTHRQAVKAGRIWLQAERKELDNHANNQSWAPIRYEDLPPGRRVHTHRYTSAASAECEAL